MSDNQGNDWLCPKVPHIPLYGAVFEGKAVYSDVQNHSIGHYQVHSFSPIMHLNNKFTAKAHSKVRSYIDHCSE